MSENTAETLGKLVQFAKNSKPHWKLFFYDCSKLVKTKGFQVVARKT